MRVVSLLPSATELVAAVGCADRLVGRSHECDFPPGVERLPVLTETCFEAEGTSREIEDRVRDLLERGLSVYRVDAARLRELRPDVIVTQAQCDVCAVSLSEVQAAVSDWLGDPVEIASLAPSRLSEVWSDLRRVGEALGVAAEAARVAASLEARVEAIAERCRGRAEKPRVATIEWIEPLMAAGNWVPELVDLAGGENLFGRAGEHSPWMEWGPLREADPDVIVVMPCGFDLATTRRESAHLEALEGWRELRAVRDGRVVLVEGNQYFNRPGPRLVESLEILAEVLQGREVDYGHEGVGWELL